MVFDVAVRAEILDETVRRFVRREPDAVVLDLGAGLDSRILRVDPPATVDWYDVDFPEVVALRRQLLPHPANAHDVGADLTDEDWLRDIPADRPAIIVADGLLLFLAQNDLEALLRRLVAHFPSGEVAFNPYTTYAVRTFKRARAMRVIAPGIANPGLNDPRQVEDWARGLRLVDETFLTRSPEVAELPLPRRWASRLAATSPRLSRIASGVVLRYRF